MRIPCAFRIVPSRRQLDHLVLNCRNPVIRLLVTAKDDRVIKISIFGLAAVESPEARGRLLRRNSFRQLS